MTVMTTNTHTERRWALPDHRLCAGGVSRKGGQPMARRTSGDRGSSDWVRARLLALSGCDNWTEHPACPVLVEWLYTVVQHRTGALGLPSQTRADVAQDAMAPVLRAVHTSRARIAAADNPAAVLERVAVRAVAAGGHRVRMAGLGGVAANGRNWGATYPRHIGGDAALRLLELLPDPVYEPCRAVEDTAARLALWVSENLNVALSSDTVDAIVYVLDRLVAGVSRGSLVRGSHSGLASDPAMRHLGFDAASAGAFACWLLGRRDAEHEAPSVLDAFLDGASPVPIEAERWRRQAVKFKFAAEAARVA
jgi:hypothetical protein